MKTGWGSATAAVLLAATSAANDALPADVAAYLRDVAAFPVPRMAALQAGEPIVKTVAEKGGEVEVVGAVRVRTTKEHVQLYFDEYMKFEDGSVVLKVGRFSDPPVAADLTRLELDPSDLDALRDCRPGDCEVKVAGERISALRAAIDWGAPDHAERANAYVRERILDYVKAYRDKGDAALLIYGDEARPVSLAGEWRALLAASPHLQGYAPELKRHLEEYPRGSLPGGRDFIQWSKVDQGLKPVIVVSHVVTYADPARPDRLSVALKQIYTSRVFRGAFSFATAVDAPPLDGRPLTYVVLVNRTRADALQGKLGVKRKVLAGEVAKGVELALRQMQEGLEKAAGAR